MEFITDNDQLRGLLARAIEYYGWAPEHNLFDFIYATDVETENNCIYFPDGCALMAKRHGRTWWLLAEPIAGIERRVPVVVEFLAAVFKNHQAQKVYCELSKETRRGVVKSLPPFLRACRVNYSLQWPIFDLAMFDPELKGNFYKNVRSVKNQFYTKHRVTISPADTAPSAALHSIIDAWSKNRGGRDIVFSEYYHNFVKNRFEGTDSARVIIVDKIARAINGGWRIPNSKRFYKAIGIHDYSLPGLGDIAMIEELTWLKSAGFESADFGGGEASVTNFKKRFGPSEFYKTFYFSVVPRA